MPDDNVVTEHEELDVDQDFSAGFADDDAGSTGDSEEKAGGELEAEAEEQTEEKQDGEEGAAEAGGEEGGEKTAKTAEERVAARAAALEEASKNEQEKAAAEQGQKQEHGQKKEPDQTGSVEHPKLTKELAKATLDFFADVVPEEEMIIGDKELNFKNLEEDVPGITDAMRLTSGRAAVKLVNTMIAEGQLITGERANELVSGMTEQVNALKAELEELRFWSSVPGHPNAMTIISDPEMVKWIGEQKPAVQKLAKSIQTPQDAADIIDMFMESKARGAAKEHDDKARAALKRENDLHGSTLRPGKKRAPGGSTDPAEDFSAGFNDED